MQTIEELVKLKENEVGPSEENVKQKIIVPLLELLGHKREKLEFEYSIPGGGRLDIIIKDVPSDCKVIVDTKNYNEGLNDHIEKMKEYTFKVSALITIIANGTEIRVYSPLRGIAFERSLLYSIKRSNLNDASIWQTLSNLLHKDNLQSKNVLKTIEEREREIKEAMAKEERLKEEYDTSEDGIDSDIETKGEEIDRLRQEKERLRQEKENKIANIWRSLDLPTDNYVPEIIVRKPTVSIGESMLSVGKARKVFFKELVDAGLLKDGQTLYLFYRERIKDEVVQVMASSNKLKYKKDNQPYTSSDLALRLLKEHGLIGQSNPSIRGPLHWQTEDGRILKDLDDQVRQKRGY